jgi:hypothetical protein
MVVVAIAGAIARFGRVGSLVLSPFGGGSVGATGKQG